MLKFRLHRGLCAVAGAWASRMLHVQAGPVCQQSALACSTMGDAAGSLTRNSFASSNQPSELLQPVAEQTENGV